MTQADVDQIVQDAQGLDALIASLEAAAQKVVDAGTPAPTDPATHEDVEALGTKLDALTAAVTALSNAQQPTA